MSGGCLLTKRSLPAPDEPRSRQPCWQKVRAMGKRVVIIALNEQGYRIGISHHNARIPQEVVDQIRDLREDDGKTYEELGRMFGLSKSVVQKICNYERRAQTPDRWKRVVIYDEDDEIQTQS